MAKKSGLIAAYEMKKRYAKGGQIPQGKDADSAKYEKRPMPDNKYNDSKTVSHNSGNKPPKNDEWTSNVTVKQAQRPSITKLSQPKIIGSDAFSVRNRDMHADEADMGDRLPPTTDRAQPPKRDDEHGPNRHGTKPQVHPEHSNGKMPYNKAIEDQYSQDMAAAEMKKVQSYAAGGYVQSGSKDMNYAKGTTDVQLTPDQQKGSMQSAVNPNDSGGPSNTMSKPTKQQMSDYMSPENVATRAKWDPPQTPGMTPGMAKGGPVMEPKDNHDELEERDDEMDMESNLSSTEHGEQPAKWRDEMDADGHNPNPLDMEDEHSTGRKPYAKGGMAHDPMNDSDDVDDKEFDLDHDASLAAAIMSKRKMMAEGGEVGVHSADPDSESGRLNKLNTGQSEAGILSHKDMGHSSNVLGKRMHKDKLAELKAMPKPKLQGLAEGGEVDGEMDMEGDDESNNREHPNGYYKRNEDAALKENMDSDFMDMGGQPMDSNETSPEHDPMDDHDEAIIKSIKRKRMTKSAISR